MNYHTMSYLAAVAALSGNLPAYDIPIESQDRGERVIVVDTIQPPVDTAYTSMMRNYYDSVWQDRKPVAPIIIIER